MKKCKYCNGMGTKAIEPRKVRRKHRWNTMDDIEPMRAAEPCDKCYGKGFK